MKKVLNKPIRTLTIVTDYNTCDFIKPLFLNLAICCAESSTAPLTIDEKTDKHGRKIRIHTSDVDLLFKEEKFRKLNTFTIDGMVQNLKRNVTDLSHLDDESIISTVKSRYIQSVSDVHEYTRQIMHDIDDVVERAKFEQKKRDTLKKIEENEKMKSNEKIA